MNNDIEYVLGIDPGKRTGFSEYHCKTGALYVWEADWATAGKEIDDTLEKLGGTLAVAIENFTINLKTAKNTSATWSLRLLGVAEYLSKQHGCVYVEQERGAAKTFSSDKRLKNLGWWKPGLAHGNDATRHMLLWLVSNGWAHDKLIVT